MSTELIEKRKLGVQFDDLEQQESASNFGMWIFLATEVLFFGGMLLAYTAYRFSYPQEFAEAGKELNLRIGTINTAVLLTSSTFMAFAVHAAKKGENRSCARNLLITWCLGFCFLALKAYEYYDDVQKSIVFTPSVLATHSRPEISRILYFIYYAMTGLHAIHLTIGLGVVAVIHHRARRNEFSPEYSAPVEVAGLYWHFVDIVWIFLYPLLYLMDRSS